MAHLIAIPQAGQTMEEATVSAWFKCEGDAVAPGDTVLEVESDKAVVPVESYYGGVLMERLVDVGDVVGVLAPVAVIAEPDETYDLDELVREHRAWVKGNTGRSLEGA